MQTTKKTTVTLTRDVAFGCFNCHSHVVSLTFGRMGSALVEWCVFFDVAKLVEAIFCSYQVLESSPLMLPKIQTKQSV